MGTSLTGLTPATTYDALIKVGDNGPLSATAKVLSDGLGNDSPLAMSTTSVGIGTTPVLRLDVKGVAADTTTVGGATVEQSTLFRPSNDSGGMRFGFDASSNAYLWSAASGAKLLLGTRSAPDNNVNMAITPAGNVGIGTSSPNTPLSLVAEHVGGQSTFKIQPITSYASSGLSSIGFNDADGTRKGLVLVEATGMNIITESTSPIRFSVNSVERGRWTTDGLTFNGDTAAANALDDYEEGTWTPSFSGASVSATIIARYTKIGRQVTIQLSFINGTISGASGEGSISGLPFTSNATGFYAGSINYADAFTTDVSMRVTQNSTSLGFNQGTSTTAANFNDGTSNRSLILTATYFV